MALVLSTPYTDTSVSGVTSLSMPLSVLNFPADFRVKSEQPQEVVLTNLTCPTDRPERIRLAISDVADIYRGSAIDANLYTPSRKGVSLVCAITDVLNMSDSSDTTYQAAVPISAHIVIKIPNNSLITGTVVKTLVGRLCDTLFSTGVVDTARLDALIRGSLKPTGV